MLRHGARHAARIAFFVIAGAAVLGFIVERLWNVLVPPIFGWHTVNFWQALGLLLLSKILFGGFHRHSGGGGRWRRRMQERMATMTPEERERFRNGVRCGRGGFTRPMETQS